MTFSNLVGWWMLQAVAMLILKGIRVGFKLHGKPITKDCKEVQDAKDFWQAYAKISGAIMLGWWLVARG